jgi:hypothetical protein
MLNYGSLFIELLRMHCDIVTMLSCDHQLEVQLQYTCADASPDPVCDKINKYYNQ